MSEELRLDLGSWNLELGLCESEVVVEIETEIKTVKG